MVLSTSSPSQEVIDEYNLLDLAHEGHMYIKIQKGVYGLSQAGCLSNSVLHKLVAIDRYHLTEHTHSLWQQDTHPVYFLLVVDDVGIKYIGRRSVENLKASIEKNYEISCYWTCVAYCGLQLDWDYNKKHS
jgi:hypothetical protein